MIEARVHAALSAFVAPAIEWAPIEAFGYPDRRQARRDAAKFGIKIAVLGKRTWVHVPSMDRVLAANVVRPALRIVESNDEGEDSDLAAAFGVQKGAA